MDEEEIKKVEVDLLLEAIARRYGYDFRQYTRAALARRIQNALARLGYQRISELIPAILWNETLGRSLISEFSLTATEMFRDPGFYRVVRQKILPYLSTYPFFRIWVAGCGSGEEVYSLAIILKEEGLYERAKIFGTDYNEQALKKARDGIFPLKDMQLYAANYQKAGGEQPFSSYYRVDHQSAIIDPGIQANITFANHNLITDGVFSEVQLVFCRNVMIYFERSLQDRVLKIICESLSHGGFLCLGSKETVQYSTVANQLTAFDPVEKIYRKRIPTGPL
jgi:chemotaxis protein methyltransferase CheR